MRGASSPRSATPSSSHTGAAADTSPASSTSPTMRPGPDAALTPRRPSGPAALRRRRVIGRQHPHTTPGPPSSARSPRGEPVTPEHPRPDRAFDDEAQTEQCLAWPIKSLTATGPQAAPPASLRRPDAPRSSYGLPPDDPARRPHQATGSPPDPRYPESTSGTGETNPDERLPQDAGTSNALAVEQAVAQAEPRTASTVHAATPAAQGPPPARRAPREASHLADPGRRDGRWSICPNRTAADLSAMPATGRGPAWME